MKFLSTLLSALLLTSFALAQDSTPQSRTTIPLVWEHQPRIDYTLEVYMLSAVPGGKVIFRRFTTGEQIVDFVMDTGVMCSTVGSKMISVNLKCGTKQAFFWFTKAPKQNANLELVQSL